MYSKSIHYMDHVSASILYTKVYDCTSVYFFKSFCIIRDHVYS